MGETTVAALRKKYHQEGLEACLTRKEQQNRNRKITGDVEARIIATACSELHRNRKITGDVEARIIATACSEPHRNRKITGDVEARIIATACSELHRNRKITGDVEARIIATACSEPPEGQATWTLRLLADKVVELHMLDSVSHETIGQVVKKTNARPGNQPAFASRPKPMARL